MSAIFGCAGLELEPVELSFFKETDPLGFILFARNIDTPDQVRALVESFRDCVGREDAPVLIDQEGGRVQRLAPPHWAAYPPALRFGEIYADSPEKGIEAARLGGTLIGTDLQKLGISVDCAPVLDIPAAGADTIIGDRAFGTNADIIIELAGAFADGLMDAGVVPVIKHIPGHGRCTVDSHRELPRVDADQMQLSETDFKTFKSLNYTAWAMTAHAVYGDIDPDLPATFSQKVIKNVIRGEIGFHGFLISDDLSMQALSGSLKDRATMALAAGCDAVLHCNGRMDEMGEVANGLSALTGPEYARFALGKFKSHQADNTDEFDEDAGRARFDALLANKG